MKTTIIFTIFLFIFVGCCNSQSKNKNIPVLFRTEDSFPKKRITILDNYISDSLKVSFQVMVDFKYPLKDTMKSVIVDSVKIVRMSVISLNKEEQIIDFSYNNEFGTPYQQYIWRLCASRFDYWYKNQPYDKMTGRNQWENEAVFGGVFYIIPSYSNYRERD